MLILKYNKVQKKRIVLFFSNLKNEHSLIYLHYGGKISLFLFEVLPRRGYVRK